MNKKQIARKESLMPNNVPKYVRIYDNSGLSFSSFDCYTVVFSGNYNNTGKKGRGRRSLSYFYLAMSAHPFDPQGFGQHGESNKIIDTVNGWAIPIGRKNHLGKRINFSDLPIDCQTFVLSDYIEIWGLE